MVAYKYTQLESGPDGKPRPAGILEMSLWRKWGTEQHHAVLLLPLRCVISDYYYSAECCSMPANTFCTVYD